MLTCVKSDFLKVLKNAHVHEQWTSNINISNRLKVEYGVVLILIV